MVASSENSLKAMVLDRPFMGMSQAHTGRLTIGVERRLRAGTGLHPAQDA